MSARPPAWRTGLLLTLMVALLLVTGWLGWKALTAPAKSATAPCASQTIAGSLTSGQVSVRVYNGGSKSGLAKSIQTQLVGKGFLVPYIGNTQEAVLQTTIVGGSADDPEVQLVAAFFPESVTQGDGRSDHSVDVLVGDTFVGFNTDAPTEIAVQSAVICLPSSPSPSPTDEAAAEPTDAPIDEPTG